jgi:hypothetical protein
MMDLKNTLLQGGGIAALVAIIVGAWGYIRSIWKYIVNIFIGESILKDDAANATVAFSFNKAIRSPLGMRVFGGYESYVHPKRWSESIVYEGITSDPILVKYNKRYALVSLAGGGEKSSSSNIGEYNDNMANVVKVRYLRWFFDIEKFIIEAVDFYNSEKRQRNGDNNKKNKHTRFKMVRYSGRGYSLREDGKPPEPTAGNSPATSKGGNRIENLIMTGVFRLLRWNREDLQMKPEDGQSPFTGYPFPDEVGEAIKELNCWLNNEKWFRSKSIPWRRGWLLYGPPGTGKSTLVRALAMYFDLPVFIFDLSSMTNDQFVKYWEEMLSNTPCIALIEDIDSVFHGRKYVGSEMQGIPHITYDCILNCISGVKQAGGVFMIVTTNFVDKMDTALGVLDKDGKSSRPGRIDKAIHLGNMAEPQRKVLAKHILSDYPELVEETVKLGDGETAAQFQSRCAQIALSRFWTDSKFLDKKPIEVVHFENKEEEEEEGYVTIPPPPNNPSAEFYVGDDYHVVRPAKRVS